MNKQETAVTKTGVPPRHKMAMAIFLVLWPLVHFLPNLTAKLISNPVAAEGVTVFAIVLVMTYLILPVVTRKIRR